MHAPGCVEAHPLEMVCEWLSVIVEDGEPATFAIATDHSPLPSDDPAEVGKHVARRLRLMAEDVQVEGQVAAAEREAVYGRDCIVTFTTGGANIDLAIRGEDFESGQHAARRALVKRLKRIVRRLESKLEG